MTLKFTEPDLGLLHPLAGEFDELYHLPSDPHEMRNLALKPAYAGKVTAMRKLAKRLRACAGDTCPKTYTPLR